MLFQGEEASTPLLSVNSKHFSFAVIESLTLRRFALFVYIAWCYVSVWNETQVKEIFVG